MAAIMEFTQFDNAVEDVVSVRDTKIVESSPGLIFVFGPGVNPGFRPGETVTYYNDNGVRFSGIIKATSQSPARTGFAGVWGVRVEHPDYLTIGTNKGGYLVSGTQGEGPVNGNGDVSVLPTPSPTMSSVLPAGLDIKKVGIGLGVLAIAYFIFKGKK